jgi:uncharacterized membrane protein YphA (DoxX/SURF4 family)
MKILTNSIRFAVGILFIFSGLIKVNDPVGMGIKLEEYFEVFGTTFMVPLALYLAVFVVVLEVALGVALLVGYRIRLTLLALLGLILFFTALTFYSAYFNKVTDCGCFGDAIKLTPWQSFGKDVVLLVLLVVLWLLQANIEPLAAPGVTATITWTSTALSLALAVYCIQFLPIIDFRAYKVGNHIPTLMQPSEPYRYRYQMKKGETTQYFEQYPEDTAWQYVAMELVNPEAKPKITDYSIWNEEGDATAASFEGNVLMLIVQNIEKASSDGMKKAYVLAKSLEKEKDMKVWIVTASDISLFKTYRHEMQLAIPYYFADATVLKTMIRANPGILLLTNGKVAAQWHHNQTPSAEKVLQIIREK